MGPRRRVQLRPLGGLPNSEAQEVHHKRLPSTGYTSCSLPGLEPHEKEQSSMILKPRVEPIHDR